MAVSDAHIAEARSMGAEAAKAAASWVCDGNTSADHARRVLEMIDNGDPMMDEYLPASPNLSGEWADDPTPRSLAYDVLGSDSWIESHDEDALADAWEEGAQEAFLPACERNLRAMLPDGDDAR